jgi:ABC-2 type transport system ATP-binding protein
MGIAEIRGLIKKIAANGKTIILASHLLDEVQKVCSHFAILRKGSLIHSGPVDAVIAGTETVEVRAEGELDDLLKNFDGTSNVVRENGYYHVTLHGNFVSRDLNKFLFENGVVVDHLVTRKKSLEQMFLEIVAEANHK